MTSSQTMDYYVRPQHLYSHSRTCTRSGLCRRLSRLVASLICYLLDHASVHEISALVTSFYCMSDMSSHYGDLDLCIFYVAMTTYVISCFMPINGHCTLMYPRLLYVFVVICRVVLLYYVDWVAGIPLGFVITPFLGWTCNVFRPSYDSSNLTN